MRKRNVSLNEESDIMNTILLGEFKSMKNNRLQKYFISSKFNYCNLMLIQMILQILFQLVNYSSIFTILTSIFQIGTIIQLIVNFNLSKYELKVDQQINLQKIKTNQTILILLEFIFYLQVSVIHVFYIQNQSLILSQLMGKLVLSDIQLSVWLKLISTIIGNLTSLSLLYEINNESYWVFFSLQNLLSISLVLNDIISARTVSKVLNEQVEHTETSQYGYHDLRNYVTYAVQCTKLFKDDNFENQDPLTKQSVYSDLTTTVKQLSKKLQQLQNQELIQNNNQDIKLQTVRIDDALNSIVKLVKILMTNRNIILKSYINRGVLNMVHEEINIVKHIIIQFINKMYEQGIREFKISTQPQEQTIVIKIHYIRNSQDNQSNLQENITKFSIFRRLKPQLSEKCKIDINLEKEEDYLSITFYNLKEDHDVNNTWWQINNNTLKTNYVNKTTFDNLRSFVNDKFTEKFNKINIPEESNECVQVDVNEKSETVPESKDIQFQTNFLRNEKIQQDISRRNSNISQISQNSNEESRNSLMFKPNSRSNILINNTNHNLVLDKLNLININEKNENNEMIKKESNHKIKNSEIITVPTDFNEIEINIVKDQQNSDEINERSINNLTEITKPNAVNVNFQKENLLKTRPSAQDNKPKKILHSCSGIINIDDEQCVLNMNKNLFKRKVSLEINTVLNSESLIYYLNEMECCNNCKNKKIIIICDQMLENEQGSDVVRKIKDLKYNLDLIIFGLSSSEDIYVKKDFMSAGIEQLYIKPLKINQIKEIVQQFK